MEGAATGMVAQVTTMLTQLLEWIGTVISSLTGSSGGLSELLPLVMIAVAISLVMLAVKVIKKVIWGY